MKFVVFFAPNFCTWPIEIIREMMKHDRNLEVIGFAVDQEIFDKVSCHKDIPMTELYNLDELEKKWISEPVSDEDFKSLEDEVGSDVLRKTVIADKNLASGWIDGAIIFDTPLAAKARDRQNLKSYTYGFYKFLLDVYKKHNPDLAFVYTIASGVTYAIGAAAHHHGFPFLRFQHSRIQKFFILDTTLEGGLEPVQNALEQSKNSENYSAEFYKPAEEYLKNYRSASVDTSNLVLNKKIASKAMQWPSIMRSLAGIVLRSFKKAFLKNDIPLRERPERLNFVFKVSSAVIRRYFSASKYVKPFKDYKDKHYVYFPLHVDPEASTLISAPLQANQTSIIEALSKSVPLSSTLLIKEHPIMIGKRPRGFYKKIAKMPNVVLIDHQESAHDLIKNAALVSTITGTAGWEAMVMQKPLLLLGETPYMKIGAGFIFCSDYTKLHAAILQAFDIQPVSDEGLIKYIAAVMKAGVFVPDEMLWNQSAGLLEKHKDITENLAHYFLNYPSSQVVDKKMA